MRLSVSLTFAILCAASAAAAEPRPRIVLEILTRPGVPLNAPQDWSKALADLKLASVQIRSGGPRDEAAVAKQGPAASPAYRVVGILATDNRLYLPGGKFAISDTAGLRKWFANLGEQGTEAVTQPRQAFGLTARNLESVLHDLKTPIASSTQGQSADRAVREVAKQLKFPLAVDRAAERDLANVKTTEELRGLSCGTGLAVIVRSCGLGLYPTADGGQLHYRVEPAAKNRQAWPIGRKSQERPDKVLPALLEFVNVEIRDTSVADAAAAIQGRMKVPFLWDQNALAAHGIDPAMAKADVPEKRMTYSQTLYRVLLQAKLKYELRVDDAEQPFVWITSVRPVP